jgi:hypothetical protein
VPLIVTHGPGFEQQFRGTRTACVRRPERGRLSATRLGVEEGDEEHWHNLPDESPETQAHDIYEWVGYLQETLVEALSDR